MIRLISFNTTIKAAVKQGHAGVIGKMLRFGAKVARIAAIAQPKQQKRQQPTPFCPVPLHFPLPGCFPVRANLLNMPLILKIKCLLNINYIECPQPIILSSPSSTAARISRIRRSLPLPTPSLRPPSAKNFRNWPFGRNLQAPSRNSNKKKIGRRSGGKPPTKILIFSRRSSRDDA